MFFIPRKISNPWILLVVTYLCLSNPTNAQSLNQKQILHQFDAIVGYGNSGIYFGKPNTPYPNIDEDNHPFFEYLDYQNASLTYKGQLYFDVQIRYDIVKDEIQILPDNEFNLLGITLFSEFVSSFSIGGHDFIKFNNVETEKKFCQVILENPTFSLLKTYLKKEKEKLKGRNVLYYEYVLDTSLIIFSEGKAEKIKSKKQLLSIFPNHKDILNKLFQENKSRKTSKDDAIIAVLKDWQTIILNPKTVE